MSKTSPTTSIHLLIAWIIATLLVSCSFSNPDNTCKRFKTGDFIYHLKTSDYKTDFLITRNDSVQTEVDKTTGKSSKFSVKWTGECMYELLLLESTNDFSDSIQRIRKRIPSKTQILSSTEGYYIFQTKRDGYDFTLTDTMWVLNKETL